MKGTMSHAAAFSNTIDASMFDVESIDESTIEISTKLE